MYNVLITFDYELFLGTQSGTVAQCMLQPTEEIAKVLSKNKAIAIFFVDSYYLYVLKKQAAIHTKAADDYNAIQQQLTALYNSGHYIFYHIHPHWLDAVYNADTNTWTLPSQEKYCFSDLTEQEQTHVFDASVTALNEILRRVSNYIQPDGYRAGGLYIQPFHTFKPHFEKHGIKYEFSVLPGAKGMGVNSHQQFDFTTATRLIYNFEQDVVQPDNKGRFTQYALEVLAINGINKVMNRIYAALAARTADTAIYGKGLPTKNRIMFDVAKYPQGRWNSYEIYSAENLNLYKVGMYLKHLKQAGYLHLLSHPKLMSPHSVQMLDFLLQSITKMKEVNYDFKKITIQ